MNPTKLLASSAAIAACSLWLGLPDLITAAAAITAAITAAWMKAQRINAAAELETPHTATHDRTGHTGHDTTRPDTVPIYVGDKQLGEDTTPQ